MSLVLRLLPDNPVLTKELRVRMRGARAYWILFGYLGFLTGVLLLAYSNWLNQVATAGGGASESARLGAEIFTYVIVVQMFLVLFITPAITSGSITLEKEQRTLDMLTMTRMSRRSIIVGKMLSAISFTALLIISSLPLVSICFMLGSIDPAMVVSTFVMLLFGSFLIGAMGLMWSSIAKTTTIAVMLTYGTLFVTCVFGGIIWNGAKNPFAQDIFANVLRSMGAPLFGPSFLGIQGMEGIGFSVVCTLAGVLMAAIAMSRLEMFPERQARLLRGLTLLLVGVLLLGVDNWWLNAWYHRVGQAVQMQMQAPISVLMVTVLVLFLLVPTFATGELRPYEARRFVPHLLWGWTPKGLSRGKLASGLPFLLITTVVCLGVFALSFVLNGKAGDIGRAARLAPLVAPPSSSPTMMTVIVNGRRMQVPVNPNGQMAGGAFTGAVTTVNGQVVTAPAQAPVPKSPPPANYAATCGDFAQAAVMLLAFVLGLSLLCMFLSVAFRNRWVAWFLCNVFLVCMVVAPERARQPIYDGMEPGITVNLYYLNPIQSLYQMGDPAGYWDHNNMLPMGHLSMWLCVTLGWLTIGGLSLLLTLPFVARERKINEEIPYEELVAAA
jgi:ABC-type transport system involved in multi-copper enzyme maturation permease subunit